MINKPVLVLDDFSGGYLSSYPTFKDPKYTPDALNVYCTVFKTLMKRQGYAKLNSASQSATANGITNYVKSESAQYLVALWGTALKSMDVVTSAWDGTWDTINASANGTALSANFMHTTIMNGDLVITTEGRDVPQKYDPSDNSAEYTNLHYGGTGTAVSAKYCLNWHSHLWLANTASDPDRLYRSALGDHTTYSATDYETLITPRDVGLTGLAILNGRMYVFKKFSIHRITYIGGTPLLDIKQVRSWVGTSSPRSIQNVDIPGTGEVLIYLGTDMQLYKFDGFNTVPIGAPILNYAGISTYCLIGDGTTYGINPAKLANVHTVVYPEKNWYVLFFCKDNDTTPSDAFVYDYNLNCFWPFHFANAFTASCTADNGAGQRKVYVAGVNYAWLNDSTNADDTVAINGYWDSMKIASSAESNLKKIQGVRLSTNSTAATPTFASRVNWDSSYDTADTLLASTNAHILDIPRIANLMQFQFKDNSTSAAFELHKLELTGEEIGGGV